MLFAAVHEFRKWHNFRGKNGRAADITSLWAFVAAVVTA
jgi:hypothetical protein